MEITDYLHLLDSSGLIAKLSISQGSIPCNLCPFNIREFTLKERVNKNFILNPSFYLACLIALPLFPFLWPFPFLCFAFLFFALFVLRHTHIISLFSSLSFFSCCHTHTHTHTHTSFPSFTNIKRKKSKKKNLFGMQEETIV